MQKMYLAKPPYPTQVAVALALLLALVGCTDSNKIKVTGKVTRTDGSSVVGAMIMARSNKTGKSANGNTDSDGNYVLGTIDKGDGIEPGDYYVIISENRGSYDSPRPRTFSGKYERPRTSGLQLLVKPDEDTVNDIVLDIK